MGEQHKRLLVATERHYQRGPDQRVYASGPSNYAEWATYVEVFDEIRVLARLASNHRPATEELRADGPSVFFDPLPDYRGAWQYLSNLPVLAACVRRTIEQCDAYILRVPGLVGRLAWKELTKLGAPYALEVLGDPWDALGPYSAQLPLRPLLRRVAVRDLRAMCKGAVAVHYVTREALQRRYPPAKGAYAVGFSDWMSDGNFASPWDLEKRLAQTESAKSGGRPFRVGFVGSLAQPYKGLDVLLRAIALCCFQKLNVELVAAGDGRYLAEMKSLATRLDIQNRTTFLGELPFGKSVLDLLDSIDLFVLPSRAEGLPRALLEAMSRGCPCIATNIGGIPELLDASDMVPTGDHVILAQKISEVLLSGSRLSQMARNNLATAEHFRPDLVANARREFCRYVRDHSIESSRRSR